MNQDYTTAVNKITDRDKRILPHVLSSLPKDKIQTSEERANALAGLDLDAIIVTAHDDKNEVLNQLITGVLFYNKAVDALRNAGFTMPHIYALGFTQPDVFGQLYGVIDDISGQNPSLMKDVKGVVRSAFPAVTTEAGFSVPPAHLCVHLQDLNLPGQGTGASLIDMIDRNKDHKSLRQLGIVMPWSSLAAVKGNNASQVDAFVNARKVLIYPSAKENCEDFESFGPYTIRDIFRALTGDIQATNRFGYTGELNF